MDEEIERLEGPRWSALAPQSNEVKMWKRSYLVACHAREVLTQRVANMRKTSWDTPMVFFYPEPEENGGG